MKLSHSYQYYSIIICFFSLFAECTTEHIFNIWPKEAVDLLKEYAVSYELRQEIQAVLCSGNVLECLSAIYCGTGFLRIHAKRKLQSLGFIFHEKNYVFSIKKNPGYIFKMACLATDGKNYSTEFENISRVIRASELRRLPGLIVPRKWFYVTPHTSSPDYKNIPKVIVVAEYIDLEELEPYKNDTSRLSQEAQKSLAQVDDVHSGNVFVRSDGKVVVIDTEVFEKNKIVFKRIYEKFSLSCDSLLPNGLLRSEET